MGTLRALDRSQRSHLGAFASAGGLEVLASWIRRHPVCRYACLAVLQGIPVTTRSPHSASLAETVAEVLRSDADERNREKAQEIMESWSSQAMLEEDVAEDARLGSPAATAESWRARMPRSPSAPLASIAAASLAPGAAVESLFRWPDSEDVAFSDSPVREVTHTTFRCGLRVAQGSPLDREISDAGLSHKDFFEGLHRYNHYVAEGVPASLVAPFETTRLASVGALVESDSFWRLAPDLGASGRAGVVSEVLLEATEDYELAVRRATVDHLLLDERARRRAGVHFVPRREARWGDGVLRGVEGAVGRPAPEAWGPAARAARAAVAASLGCFSRASVALLDLWERELAGLLLVDLPEPAASEAELLGPGAFFAAQAAQLRAVRGRLEGEWRERTAELLRAQQAAHGVGAELLRRAASVLMAIQVRGAVERSISALVGFLGRFGQKEPMAPDRAARLGGRDDADTSFLVVRLTVEEGAVRFAAPLRELGGGLLDVFRRLVTGLSGLVEPGAGGDGSGGPLECQCEALLSDSRAQLAISFIGDVVSLNTTSAEKTLRLYDEFEFLLEEEAKVRRLVQGGPLTQQEYVSHIERLLEAEARLSRSRPEFVRLQLVSVDCRSVNEALRQGAAAAVGVLLQAVADVLLSMADALIGDFEALATRLSRRSEAELTALPSVSELVSFEAAAAEFRAGGREALLEAFGRLCDWLAFAQRCEERCCVPALSGAHFQRVSDASGWVGYIDEVADDAEERLQREREMLEQGFEERRGALLEEIQRLRDAGAVLRSCSNLRHAEEYLERAECLRAELARARVEAGALSEQERSFGWEPRELEELRRGEQELEPLCSLWALACDLARAERSMLRAALFSLDPIQLRREVHAMLQEAQRLREVFLEDSTGASSACGAMASRAPTNVAGQLEKLATRVLTRHVGLAQALCNESLQARHWEQISGVLGVHIHADAHVTLKGLLASQEAEAGGHALQLQLISEAATREHEIERLLDAMETDWKFVELEFHLFHSSRALVLAEASLEEVRVVIQDQLRKTVSARLSPQSAAWAARLASWEEWLVLADEVAEGWASAQELWTRVEPISSSAGGTSSSSCRWRAACSVAPTDSGSGSRARRASRSSQWPPSSRRGSRPSSPPAAGSLTRRCEAWPTCGRPSGRPFRGSTSSTTASSWASLRTSGTPAGRLNRCSGFSLASTTSWRWTRRVPPQWLGWSLHSASACTSSRSSSWTPTRAPSRSGSAGSRPPCAPPCAPRAWTASSSGAPTTMRPGRGSTRRRSFCAPAWCCGRRRWSAPCPSTAASRGSHATSAASSRGWCAHCAAPPAAARLPVALPPTPPARRTPGTRAQLAPPRRRRRRRS
ncbi:unnamed protein product [Prorocentrum cordatum]|uniref:Dynein heavy chain linker domain-containing protein n=1 Tax=Prorocentrum cordatum TaxID=2364126 RepID=A0ABN9S8R3_9DINO|nr:unnamed protein product [Polarella glacialis]